MATSIGPGGPVRPTGTVFGTGQADPPARGPGEGADTAPVAFRGRTVRLAGESGAALPAAAARAAVAALAGSGTAPKTDGASPLAQRQVATAEHLPPALTARRNGQEVLGLRLAGSALADGPVFRAEAARAGLEPDLLAEAQRATVDRLVAGVPVSAKDAEMTRAVLADALAAAIDVVAKRRDGDGPTAVAERLAAGAMKRAGEALMRNDADAPLWLGEAALRTCSASCGGRRPAGDDVAAQLPRLFDSMTGGSNLSSGSMGSEADRTLIMSRALGYIADCGLVLQ